MMLSVIVPSFNSEKTLDACLTAIFSSVFSAFEVIVVDDGSSDGSAGIARNYPCRIVELKTNTGLSHARNTGVIHSRHEHLVFIDADVVIKNDTLSMMARYFENHPGVSGIVGLLDKNCPHGNFFSQYKNLYMHHIFKEQDSIVSFLYGSLHAIRKKDFEPYDESLPYAEDTELGQRLSSQGKTIVLLKDLEVTHLKRHSPVSILINDFRIPFYWARLFLACADPQAMAAKKGFAHARIRQVSSVVLSPCLLLALVLMLSSRSWALPVLGLMIPVYMGLNMHFFIELYKVKGVGFTVGSVLFTLLDQTVMALGIAVGTVYSFFKRRRPAP